MPDRITIHRTRTSTGERLVLLAPDFCVTIELTIRGLELDATTVERLLHAPLGVLATQTREML